MLCRCETVLAEKLLLSWCDLPGGSTAESELGGIWGAEMRDSSQDGCQPPTAPTQALAGPAASHFVESFCSVCQELNLFYYETVIIVTMAVQSREGVGMVLALLFWKHLSCGPLL